MIKPLQINLTLLTIKSYLMQNKLFFLLIMISSVVFGCKSSQQSWLYYTDTPAVIYEDPALTRKLITVPAGKYVFVKKKSPPGQVSYGETKGYTYLQTFETKQKITKRDLRYLHFSPDSMYVFSNNTSSNRRSKSSGSGLASTKSNSSSKKKSSGGSQTGIGKRTYT